MKFEETLLNDVEKSLHHNWGKGHRYFGLGYGMIGMNRFKFKAKVYEKKFYSPFVIYVIIVSYVCLIIFMVGI